MIENDGPASGLTEVQAKEFHAIFQTSFLIFLGVAVFAHLMAWIWRPWLPGPNGYASLQDSTTNLVGAVMTMLT